MGIKNTQVSLQKQRLLNQRICFIHVKTAPSNYYSTFGVDEK